MTDAEWDDAWNEGRKYALRKMLRYVVAALGEDADEELDKLLGERQMETPDFILDTGESE